MTLKDEIMTATKDAMREKDSARLSTLRMLQAAIQRQEIDSKQTLTDAQITAVIERQIKQLRESSAIYEQAGRTETAEQEKAEITVLQTFLPKQANESEVNDAVKQAIEKLQADGVQGPALMGQTMAALKQSLAGRADMGLVSKIVREHLSKVS